MRWQIHRMTTGRVLMSNRSLNFSNCDELTSVVRRDGNKPSQVQIVDILLHFLKSLAQWRVLPKLSFQPCVRNNNFNFFSVQSDNFNNLLVAIVEH